MPIELISRPYTGADLPHIVDLLATRLAAGGHFDITVADLRQVLPRPSTASERHGRVWQDARGEIVGFGLVWPPSNTVLMLVQPGVENETIQPPLVDRIVQWVIEHGQDRKS